MWEKINLDNISVEDAKKYAEDKSLHWAQSRYAYLIWLAKSSRLDGNIEIALQFETQAEINYQHLPENLKW